MLSHAEHLEMPRDTPLKRTLFACDELSGFVHACGLVRPTGVDGLEPKSVKKKLKQPSFAAGVHRDEVYAGAELLGLDLDEHIRNVVAALQPIAGARAPYGRRRRLALRQRVDQAGDVALVVPVADRRTHEARAGQEADDHTGLFEPNDEFRGVPAAAPGDERRLLRRRDHLLPGLDQRLATARRQPARPLVRALRVDGERRLDAREQPGRKPAVVEPPRAVLGHNVPSGSNAAWLKYVGKRTAKPSGSRTYSAPVESGQQSHFWPETV